MKKLVLCSLIITMLLVVLLPTKTYTAEETVGALRGDLLKHKERMTYFTDTIAKPEELYEQALQHQEGALQDGEYIKYHIKSIDFQPFYSGGRLRRLIVMVDYYSTLPQERAALQKAKTVVASLRDPTPKTIYQWLFRNVSYDEEHATSDAYAPQYTAYAALCEGKATCVGFANAFVLLCRVANIDAGYRKGQLNGNPHVWNIVKQGTRTLQYDATNLLEF